MTITYENQDNTDKQVYGDLPPAQAAILLLSISVVALCGIVYELIIGAVSTYLLGNSIYQFSITIGFFMFAMGIGSFLSQFIKDKLIQNFIYIEVALALIGGVCSISLFFAFPFTPFMYQTIMFSFILVIGTLVGLEIPILTRILSQVGGVRKSIANVLSLDYVGALIGSVAFPLLLLPGLGLVRASFAIGLINIFVAFLNVIYLRKYLEKPKELLIIVICVFATLFTLTIIGTRLTSIAQQNLYFDQVIWHKQTPYQKLIVTNDWKRGDLRLFIDGHIQFSEIDEHRYHESLVHPVMAAPGKIENVLVMGGGDGLAVRELLKYPGIKRIDLVDIDPAMTRMGKDFAPLRKLNKDSLSDKRVHIYNEDGFIFIKRKGPTYDRVILDFPDPHNEVISKLYSIEFYTMLSRRMSEDGILVSQSSSPFFARQTFWSIEKTMGEVFAATKSYHVTIPAFGIWGFNMASKVKDINIGTIQADTKYLTPESFHASMTFGKDTGKLYNVPKNSIFEPVLYQLYLADLKNNPADLINKPKVR
ncbi:MAG: polyamine aminopropyltransferase [Methyloligellaceae bacterium]